VPPSGVLERKASCRRSDEGRIPSENHYGDDGKNRKQNRKQSNSRFAIPNEASPTEQEKKVERRVDIMPHRPPNPRGRGFRIQVGCSTRVINDPAKGDGVDFGPAARGTGHRVEFVKAKIFRAQLVKAQQRA
jgi:hypothetical protein